MSDARTLATLCYAQGKWFPMGMQRLRQSLDTFKLARTDYFWLNELPPHCPSHQQSPYAFKYFALEHARTNKHRLGWWLDSSLVMVGSHDRIFQHARAHGIYLSRFRSYTVGQYTSDEALDKLKLSRDEAMTIPMVDANTILLDFNHPAANQLLQTMLDFAVTPGLFAGPWTNEHNAISSDLRVLGHRHDQSVLSVVAHRMKLETFAYSDLITRSSLHYRLFEKGTFVCRRACVESELRGRVGSLPWRVRQKLNGL
jgi:hypothetical protein